MDADRWRDLESVRSDVRRMQKQEGSLSDRLSRLEAKVDLLVRLVFAQVGVGGSLLVALLAAIVAFVLTQGH